MIYTLFIWTVVATQADNNANYQKSVRDWRALATVEPYGLEQSHDKMMAKCEDVARQLNISKERYRCVRTK